jgi:PEP-CTERM motif-containing protein
MVRTRLFSASVILTSLSNTASAATNLVQNPGFELGTGGGWTDVPGWGIGGGGLAGIVRESGSVMAMNGCAPNLTLPCGISRVLPTVAGQAYTLGFGFNPGGGPDEFAGYDYVRLQVLWDGVVVEDLGGGPLGWTDFTLDGLIATSDATTLTFRGYAAAMSGVDNVSVTASAAAVPEPASWALMISGFGAAGAALRRRRAAKAVLAG